MYQLTKQRKYLRFAKPFVRTIDDWVDRGNPNVRWYGELLKAELQVVARKFPRAELHYETAILLAGRRGRLNIQALAQQRRAESRLSRGLKDDAAHDIRQALGLYENWGALGKVRQLKRKHKGLLDDSEMLPTLIDLSVQPSEKSWRDNFMSALSLK